MELISLGIIPEDVLDDENSVRKWVLVECAREAFLTGYPHRPEPSAICLRVAQTGPEHAHYLVTVCDLICDDDGHEGLPVTYHDLGGEESILHA